MTNPLQTQFSAIQNAFSGAKYVPGVTGNPGSYTQQKTPAQPMDMPIQNLQGQWVSSLNKTPWNGGFTNQQGSTSYYKNGVLVPTAGAAAAPDFTVTATPKNPVVAGQVAGAIANDQPALLTKSFNDYLNEANQLGSSGATSLTAGQAAVNPQPTIDAVNQSTAATTSALDANNAKFSQQQGAVQQGVTAATGQYTGDVASRLAALQSQLNGVDNNLATTNQTYAGQQQGVQDQIAASNQDYANTANSNLNTLGTNLATDNSNYAAAAQNVASQAYQAAQKQIAAYQMGTGTPTSGSGSLDNRYIRAYDSINVPLQQDLANRNLAQTNQLYNLGQGVQNTEYGNTMNQYAGQSALNSDITNRGTSLDQYLAGQYGNVYGLGASADSSVLGANLGALNTNSNINSSLNTNANNTALQTGQLNTGSAEYIAQLKQATAGMPIALASQYLQSIGAPIGIAQQVIAGQTSNLSALNNLDQSATAYTFSTPYQNNAPTYNQNTPQLPGRGPAPTADTGTYSGSNPFPQTFNAGQTPGNSTFSGGANPMGWAQGSDGNWYSKGQNGQWQLVYQTNSGSDGNYGAPTSTGTGSQSYSGSDDTGYSIPNNFDFTQPSPFGYSDYTPAQAAQMQATYS